MKNTVENQIDYLSVITSVFPNALIKSCENFDDVYFGWEICPSPGHYIRFGVQMYAETKIQITKSTLVTWGESAFKKAICSNVYKGDTPVDYRLKPDLNFIKSLLENYHNIGSNY